MTARTRPARNAKRALLINTVGGVAMSFAGWPLRCR